MSRSNLSVDLVNRYALATLLLLAFVAPLRAEAPATADPVSVGMDAKALAKIAPRMEEFVKNGKTSGVVTLVARQGKIVHLSAVGEADIETHRPMKTDSIFAIASMTKPITGAALMILVDEGKVSLDDPASKYIPEFKAATLESGAPKREIVVRDLLTHTSGIPGDQANLGSIEKTAIEMSKRKLAFEPGTKWQYGPGLTIIGRIIEVASGKPYDKFLDERLFRPLKMTETTFFPTEEQRKRVPELYQPGKDGQGLAKGTHWLVDFSKERTANPSGGLFSTAGDLARFYQMVLNGGELDGQRILSKKAVEQMTTCQTSDIVTGFTPGNCWGLGWCLVREPQGVTKMLSAGTAGHGGAFGTQGWIDPKKQMTYVLLIQRTNFGSGDGADIRADFQQLAAEAVKE